MMEILFGHFFFFLLPDESNAKNEVPGYKYGLKIGLAWWRHQMETFSALLALCARNSPVTGAFPSQRPVTRSVDVFFDLRLNKRLSEQLRRWRFGMQSRSLWHYNGVHKWSQSLYNPSYISARIATVLKCFRVIFNHPHRCTLNYSYPFHI